MAIMRMPSPTIAAGGGIPGGAMAAPAPGGAPATVPAAAPAATATEVAAPGWFTVASIIAVVIGWVVVIAAYGTDATKYPPALKVNGDVSTFAMFYLAAQAIERALEPFSNLILKTDTIKKELDQLVATALASRSQADGVAAAKKQDDLDRLRGERGLVLWATATVLGILLSGFTGLYFVNAILAQDSSFSRPLDILITGLVIGGGSKPLHDLITNIQKTKEQTEDPPETNPKK